MNRPTPSPAVTLKRRRAAVLLIIMAAAAVTVLASSTGGPANGLHLAACLTLAGATVALIRLFEDRL